MVTEHRGLSPSSLTLFTACQRRYFYKKIVKYPIDSDCPEDYEAFSIGKAFHQALEDTMHNLEGYTLASLVNVCKSHNVEDNKAPMIFAMLSAYKEMHKKVGLPVIACEKIIETDSFYGIVDVVLGTPEAFYLGDMKTASFYGPDLIPTLLMHPQLNLYAAHVEQLADSLDLDVKNYQGCHYRVVTKSKLVQKTEEKTEDYIKRMRKGIKCADIFLPKEKMNPTSILKVHADALSHMQMFGPDESAYCQNFGNCMSYYRPCEFYSRCHGALFTEDRGLEITEV